MQCALNQCGSATLVNSLLGSRKSHLDALAGEEADVEAPLAPPPDGLVRLGHVDHRDHVTHLEEKQKHRQIKPERLETGGRQMGTQEVQYICKGS